MRPVSSRQLVMALLLAVAATPLFAVTYIVPSDREMIQRSDDIVVATSVTSTVERTPRGGIVTRYVLRVEDVLKGKRAAGSYLTLTELGGELAPMSLYLSGMPVYEPGYRYLVFADTNAEGEPKTWGLELGQFLLQKEDGGPLIALRNAGGFDQNLETFREGARDARGFMKYIRGIVAQRIDPTPAYFVAAPAARVTPNATFTALFTRGSYLLSGNPRWSVIPNAALVTSGTPSGANGVTAVDTAIGQWNGTGLMSYSNAGVDNTATAGFTSFDDKSAVLFGDPNGEVTPPVVGRGGYWTSNTSYQVGGETFKDIDGGVDVVIDNVSFTQSCLNSVMTHEIGHTFGFRHSNQNPDGGTCNPGSECTSTAIMNSSVDCGFNGVLRPYDQNAADTVYGSGPQCTPPSISSQPQDQTITQGNSTTLSVGVSTSSSGPFSYQWYIGSPPSTSQPTGTNSPSLNVSPSTTTTYWVRVTGQCAPTVDSNAATVTVNPGTCTPPSISSHPQNQTITQGSQASLSVGVSGTGPFVIQWYVGTPPNTSQLAGTGSPLLVSPNVTTQYWARVIGQCDPPALSNAATITVNPSSCPSVTVGNPTATRQPNGTYLLDVIASSGTRGLTYQWFQGPVPGNGTFIGNGRQIIVPAPTGAVSYWVRVFNDCSNDTTSPTVVTISSCEFPVITTEPADQSIASGASATLSVAFTSSTDATVRWYRGIAPDKSNQIGTGTSVSTGALTTTTKFWAGITNTCGEKLTRTATITVGSACTKPSITSATASMTINKGALISLSVVATGTAALHYQWYEGVSGDTSKPVGIDFSAFNTGPVNASTKFWVKVTNSCGDASSNTINVDLKSSRHRAARH